jgi:hypothetical protein
MRVRKLLGELISDRSDRATRRYDCPKCGAVAGEACVFAEGSVEQVIRDGGRS